MGKLGLGEIKNAKVLEIGLKLRRWETFPQTKNKLTAGDLMPI